MVKNIPDLSNINELGMTGWYMALYAIFILVYQRSLEYEYTIIIIKWGPGCP